MDNSISMAFRYVTAYRRSSLFTAHYRHFDLFFWKISFVFQILRLSSRFTIASQIQRKKREREKEIEIEIDR